MDVIEYIPKKMYGVKLYAEGEKKSLDGGRWIATMMTYSEVMEYIDWCDLYCDKIIYNNWTKKPDADEWK